MKLLVIRHAVAADPSRGQPEAVRPLTVEGRNKMRRAAKGLALLVPEIDLLVSSPLVRAVETASIVGHEFPKVKIKEIPQLEPGSPTAALLDWIAQQPASTVVGLIGHEPDLGRIVSLALAARDRSFFKMKKGAACLLEFLTEVKPGRATLRWAMAPSHLRRLARRK
jgi:phosphohistidine phosphatase